MNTKHMNKYTFNLGIYCRLVFFVLLIKTKQILLRNFLHYYILYSLYKEISMKSHVAKPFKKKQLL